MCGCRAECGLMQQLVLVTLVLDDYTAAPSPACRMLLKDSKAAVVVIGEAPFWTIEPQRCPHAAP